MALTTENPAHEVCVEIVKFLRNLAPALGLDEGQIREVLDVSGQPKDLAGITVGVADKGDHPGCVGRVLVDVEPTVTIWTHINDDADGSLCNTIAGAVLADITSITYNCPSWKVAFKGSWSMTAPTAAEAYRAIRITATLPLVRGGR